MAIKILGQGLEATSENSVGSHLMKFLADKNFHSFHGITAFTSLAGIKGLQKHLENANHLKKVTITTGVDQKGTSKEALQALLGLKVNSYVFFVPPRSPIFHPKIYIFEGVDKSELIIGSSNLTANGLFTNVEASVLISIDNHDITDTKIIEDLKRYFSSIFDGTDPNLKLLTTELIEDLVKLNIVPTEAERKELQVENIDKAETQNILSKIFPKRVASQVPKDFRAARKAETKTVLKDVTTTKATKLLWESGPLTERDLNIPKGSNTNPTGSMLFKKGITENIDQRHYFRDEVFSSIKWIYDTRKGSKHLEKAAALFRIVVMGRDYGTFALTLTHNPRTDTRSYEQKNSMTSISWGDTKSIIARDELIGKSAKLYGSPTNNGEYTLLVD